jgi:hypothetical protein
MPFPFWRTVLLTSGSLVLTYCGEPATQQPSSLPPASQVPQAGAVPPTEMVRRFYQWYLTDIYLKEPSVGGGPTGDAG